MKMNPEEITAIIKDQIKNYEVDLNVINEIKKPTRYTNPTKIPT